MVDVTAIIVNYNTASLIMPCVESVLDRYPGLPMVLVDNGSSDGSRQYIIEIAGRPDIKPILNSYNAGHGPGMHAGISTARAPYLLLMDSDCILFRGGLIEAVMEHFDENIYAIGQMQWVNGDGINVDHTSGYPYVHPSTMLINRELYWQLPPFEHHGAPCISNMIAAGKAGYGLVDFPVDKYIYHRWRGTREGLNVNWDGKPGQKKGRWSRWLKRINILSKR